MKHRTNRCPPYWPVTACGLELWLRKVKCSTGKWKGVDCKRCLAVKRRKGE